MLQMLALAYEFIQSLNSLRVALPVFFGLKEILSHHNDFGVDVSNVVIPVESNDLDLTKSSNSLSLDGVFSNKKVSSVEYADKINNEVLSNISNFKVSSSTSLDVDISPVKEPLELSDNSKTLLDVLKSNNTSLLKSLSVISQNMVAQTQAQVFQGQALAYGISSINERFDKFISLIGAQNLYLKSLIEILDDRLGDKSVSNSIDMLKEVIDKKNMQPIVETKTDVNVDTKPIADVFDVIKDDVKTIAKAKELEKENYEYMKTPKTYDLIDENIPALSPRDAIALSEVIKAHLNSQEAVLDGSEIEDLENDFDTGDIISQLFKFSGITKDIEKFKGDNNGS